VDGPASGSTFPAGETTIVISAADGHGNNASCSFTIKVAEAMEADPVVTHVNCFGENNGSVSPNITGGNPGLTYEWSNGANTPALENIGGGEYKLLVTDADGCQEEYNFVVNEPSEVVTDVVAIVPATGDEANGSVDISVSGGVQPYQFAWTDAEGNLVSEHEDLENIPAGTYLLTVTDANGCQGVHAFTIESTTNTFDREWANQIQLYPNPTTGMVTLEITGQTSSEVSVVVYDVNGRLVADFPQSALANSKRELDLSASPSGVYLVKVLIEGQIVSKRLVVGR
jgi:hypothetical protein